MINILEVIIIKLLEYLIFKTSSMILKVSESLFQLIGLRNAKNRL